MPSAQTPKQAGAFTPFLSQQLPGGSEILDRNLLAIKAAIGEVVQQFNRTVTFIGVGGGGSAGPYVPTTRAVNTSAPLTGGGSLAADLTLALSHDGTLQVSGGALGIANIFSTGLTFSGGLVTANLSTGIPGGQAVIGGTGVGENLTIKSTTNAITKGAILLGNAASIGVLDENTGKQSWGNGGGIDAFAHFVPTNDTAPLTLTAWDNRHVVIGASGSTGGGLGISHTSGTGTVLSFLSPSVAWETARFNASQFLFYGAGTTLGLSIDASGHVYDAILTSNGLLKTTGGTGQHAIAVAGTDYQAPITWPAATDILISAGTSTPPVGDSTFTYDTTNHLLATGAVGINGASMPTNCSLVVTHNTNADRDRVQLFVGAGTLGPSGTNDSTLVDIIPTNTSLNGKAVRSPAIYSTVRVRALTYTGGTLGDAVGVAASLYIDAQPGLTVAAGPTYALYAAAGNAFFGGDVNLATGRAVTAPRLNANGVSNAFVADGTGASAAVGFFGAGGGAGVVQQTGGAATAGATYTATEQGMINRMYSALRTYGLLT